MSVMSCNRSGCNNIMCDTYVKDIGYICYECQREFKEYLSIYDKNPTSENKIKKELKKFMSTEKDSYTRGKDITVDEFFNSHTRND